MVCLLTSGSLQQEVTPSRRGEVQGRHLHTNKKFRTSFARPSAGSMLFISFGISFHLFGTFDNALRGSLTSLLASQPLHISRTKGLNVKEVPYHSNTVTRFRGEILKSKTKSSHHRNTFLASRKWRTLALPGSPPLDKPLSNRRSRLVDSNSRIDRYQSPSLTKSSSRS